MSDVFWMVIYIVYVKMPFWFVDVCCGFHPCGVQHRDLFHSHTLYRKMLPLLSPSTLLISLHILSLLPPHPPHPLPHPVRYDGRSYRSYQRCPRQWGFLRCRHHRLHCQVCVCFLRSLQVRRSWVEDSEFVKKILVRQTPFILTGFTFFVSCFMSCNFHGGFMAT